MKLVVVNCLRVAAGTKNGLSNVPTRKCPTKGILPV